MYFYKVQIKLKWLSGHKKISEHDVFDLNKLFESVIGELDSTGSPPNLVCFKILQKK